MNAFLLVAPTSEPVSLPEAKAWLRLDTNEEDPLVLALVVAARQAIEAATRRFLVAQTWRLRFASWRDRAVTSPLGPRGAFMRAPALPVPFAPVASIVALRCPDSAGVVQVVPPATYRLCGAPDGAALVFAADPPGLGVSDGMELDVLLGYGAPSDVPAPIRQALLITVAGLFENRGDDPQAPALLSASARNLLAPYCRPRLA